MHIALGVVAIVVTVTAATALSRRLPISAPLLLIVVGLIASYIPQVPDVALEPEVVLFGFLPPLLYAAAQNTSLIDFRANRRPILLLSVGLVIATTCVVGLVAWLLLPIPLAVAFALGAVVAPPDAVAATAIARRIGMPRRLVTILQGESLVNDATALVALSTAIAAFDGGVSPFDVGTEFIVVALGGIAVGVGVALVTGRIRKHIKDEVTDTTISIVTPFLSYIAAEAIHCSGVLAVVYTGLLLGHKTHLMQSASSRIFERTNWRTIEFMLENTVFLLIGLQVRSILENAAASSLDGWDIAIACVAITVTAIVVRPLWVFPATYLPRLIPAVRAADPFPPWPVPTAVSWAGMRGVVSLAAVLTLPADTPLREVLIVITLVVVGVTLGVQGSSLPWLLRRLGLVGPDPAEDVLQAASVAQRASTAGLRRLDEVRTDADRDEVVERVRRRGSDLADSMWERLGGGDETPSQAYARLRLETIAAEREELLRLRDEGVVDDEVMRRVISVIDVEETVLDLGQRWSSEERTEELAPMVRHDGCDHLREYVTTPSPQVHDGCPDCVREGLEWVHLRLCMVCGQVGCCDSSVGHHASQHADRESHPVMRSFEPGEAWRWCTVDHLLG